MRLAKLISVLTGHWATYQAISECNSDFATTIPVAFYSGE
jgi:hypothetical protein